MVGDTEATVLDLFDRGWFTPRHWEQAVVLRHNDEAGWGPRKVRLPVRKLAYAFGLAMQLAARWHARPGPRSCKEAVAYQILVGSLHVDEVDRRIGWQIDGLYVGLKDSEKEWVRLLVEGARRRQDLPPPDAPEPTGVLAEVKALLDGAGEGGE